MRQDKKQIIFTFFSLGRHNTTYSYWKYHKPETYLEPCQTNDATHIQPNFPKGRGGGATFPK